MGEWEQALDIRHRRSDHVVLEHFKILETDRKCLEKTCNRLKDSPQYTHPKQVIARERCIEESYNK
jgi:hypothetical protein